MAKKPDTLITRLSNYDKGRNQKIPDWDLYDTDEEAMAAAEELMLEDYDNTPWGTIGTLATLLKICTEDTNISHLIE